jgi:hypothetical protein
VMEALSAALNFHAESGDSCNTMHIFSATAMDVLGRAALGVHIDGPDGLGAGASLAFIDGLDVLTAAGLAQGMFISPTVRKVGGGRTCPSTSDVFSCTPVLAPYT